MTSVLSLAGIAKNYGRTPAVRGVDLDVAEGEFFTMLGPSGSGKTTLLRVIAGFESPDAGTVTLAGQDITHLPPYLRATNTVFQDYALFPHMTVAANIAYGLRVRGVDRGEQRSRVAEALRMTRLTGLGERRPDQLSGGQRQRVALARAIINRPRVLLLDEPLGALDLKLRQEMQVELKRIQQEIRITFVYVTHDQEEALTMSDRIAVLHEGRLEQVGTPAEVYERPANAFVAGFIGVSNLLKRDGRTLLVRPERMELLSAGATAGEPGTVAARIYAGMMTRYSVRLATGDEVQVMLPNSHQAEAAFEPGAAVRVAWAPDSAYLLAESSPAPADVAEEVMTS